MSNEEMKDELQEQPGTEEPVELEAVEEQTEETTEQLNPEVEKARSKGWLSEEDYVKKHGTKEGYKSPEEFNEFGENYYKRAEENYKDLKKALERRDAEIAALVEYQKRTKDREFQRAKQEVEAQLKQAKEIGDGEAVEQLTKEKLKAEAEEMRVAHEQVEQARQATLNNFIKRNSYWYNESRPDLKAEAHMLDQRFKALNPNLTFDEVGQMIEMQMKINHPELQVKTAPTQPTFSAANSSVNKGSAERAPDDSRVFRTLSAEHRSIYNATKDVMKRSGIEYTQAEFIKRLKDDGEI